MEGFPINCIYKRVGLIEFYNYFISNLYSILCVLVLWQELVIYVTISTFGQNYYYSWIPSDDE